MVSRKRGKREGLQSTSTESEAIQPANNSNIVPHFAGHIESNGGGVIENPESEKKELNYAKNFKECVSKKELVDMVEISDGKNKIKITLIRETNRTMRFQIWLNDEELRPCTFMGSRPGLQFWQLFKGSIK